MHLVGHGINLDKEAMIILKLTLAVLTLGILVIASFSKAYAMPEGMRELDEQRIRAVSFGGVVGEMVIYHHLYISVDEDSMYVFEPVIDTFRHRLFGLETDYGYVTIRFNGTFDDINLSDFSEIVLTSHGEPLQFDLTMTRKIHQGDGLEYVTDIYLRITQEYPKPGQYAFYGTYKGIPFAIHIVAEFVRILPIPADPQSLAFVSVTYLPPGESTTRLVTDFSFHFKGIQHWFNVNDFRDVRLTHGGVDVPFDTHSYIVRHRLYCEDDTMTVFTLVLTEPLASPGVYQLSGFYRDTPFHLSWTQWN